MPRNTKPNPPKGKGKSSADQSDQVRRLETRYEVVTNDVNTLKSVGAIVVAVFILLSTVVIQLGIHTVRENAALRAEYTEVINDLRQENVEIRADNNQLRLEFELYKSQNPK